MRRLVGFLVVAGVCCLALWSPSGPVAAQGGEVLLTDEVCRSDPNSEDCICRGVKRISRVPAAGVVFDPGLGPQVDTSSALWDPDVVPHPVWDEDSRQWTGNEEHFEYIPTDHYKAFCSMEYFREDLRRLLYFLIALASGLVLISVAWAAVIHMMDSATGEQRSQARTIIVRTIVGLVLIAMLFVIYDQVSGLAVGTFDIWDTDVPFLQELN